MKWKTIINVGLVLIIIVGGLFVYSEISGQTILEILPFFQKPIIAQAHLGTLTISGTTELCGSYNNVWDTVYVTSSGVLNICVRNTTDSTGFVNLTLGPAGNFTVAPGGLINGTARGSNNVPGTASTSVAALQGQNGNNWSAGANSTAPNGGGGGGGSRNDAGNGAGGGGGGFGGAGGTGGAGTASTGEVGGTGGLIYGQTSNLTLHSGSGGGGGAGDAASAGGAGGAGFKVDAGLGIINIKGFVNLTGSDGIDDTAANDRAGGGGGGGGHLILYSSNITIDNAVLNVSAGSGGDTDGNTDDGGGGGGGGGRIYIVYSTISNTSVTTHALAGGGGVGSGSAGTAGTITHNQTAAMFTDNAPQWVVSSVSTNNTNPPTGDLVIHSVNWTEDGELSFAILEVNGTGASCDTTANVTSMVLVGTSNFSNLTWEVPAACAGKTIGWRIYAKDFPSNQTNVTALQMYDVQAGASDTCTYTSGNWNVLCSDNCVITSNVALGGNAMTITGTGTFTTEANITQYKNVTIRGTDTSNKCRVRCLKGGCFKH